jgi:hypothetical protein
MKKLCEKGEEVMVLSKGRFSEKRIRKKPVSFNDITKSSLIFVCKQIGLPHSFLSDVRFVRVYKHLPFPTTRFYHSMDLFVSTTKGFPWLNMMATFGKPRVAIGYQNFLGTYFHTTDGRFPDQCLPNISFERKIRRTTEAGWIESGLPFLDNYVDRFCAAIDRKNSINKVLFLHPGGYRNVFTQKGESKKSCYRKQRAFYKNLLDQMPAYMKLYIKIHPLAARYHDNEAHKELLSDLGIETIEGFLGDYLFDFGTVLSLGSSAAFEILPFGISFWILDYYSNTRTQLYSDFSSFTVKSDEDLSSRLKMNPDRGSLNEFERDFTRRIKNTADGYATDRVVKLIEKIV